jgi:4'-phosphopantetheinyl transferase
MELAWPKLTEAVDLDADTLDVWAVRLDDARLSECAATLSADELRRADAYLIDAPRRRFVATRAALRQLLGSYIAVPAHNVTIEVEENGKPWLADCGSTMDIRFNVAHSADLALLAFTRDREVGIDVERLRAVERCEQLALRYYHPEEIDEVLSAAADSRDERFLRCWTGKEAVVKALGSGIASGLALFRVPTAPFPITEVALPLEQSQSRSSCTLFGLEPCEGYVAAVACLGDARRLRCYSFAP